jgi:hypothetical protein
VFRGLRLSSVSTGETIRFLPASTASKSELIDWLVDAVGLERTTFLENNGFANVVVNGVQMGVYRMINDGPLERQTVLVHGSQMTILGDAESWLRVFDRILNSDFSGKDSLDALEQGFDLDWFSDYYLKRLFWGDRRWPYRGELIVQDPITQKWGFWPNGLKDAGALWGEGSFEHSEKKINASGAIFDSLLRSSRFRKVLADCFTTQFDRKPSILQRGIEGRASELDESFGSSATRIVERFTSKRVLARVTQLRHFLIQQGWVSTSVMGVNENVSFSGDKSDASRFHNDLWLIKSREEKKVLISVSDHHFEWWRSLDFDDGNWATVRGVLGFDTRGFSGQEIRSQVYNLLHNRSSGPI